jgi:UDP-N-acetylmuramoyl-tripeptide--D-alanyl-D-alanine ligase
VDAHNANPSSMAAALENLRLADHPHKVALLGEMRELGKESNAEHRAVLRQVLSLGLDRVCLVGEEFGRAAFDEDVLDRVECFLTSVDLADRLAEAPVEGCLVLVKGARGTMMEKVIPKL